MMNINKLMIFILLNIFLTNSATTMDSTPNYEKIAAQITIETAIQLKKEHNLQACGDGGSMMDNIKVMSLSFMYNHILEVESARNLIISSTQSYLSKINKNKEIRPFLLNYPFSPENIEILIMCQNYDGTEIVPGRICGATTYDGKIIYYMNDENFRLKRKHSESYEEALRIAGNEGSSK